MFRYEVIFKVFRDAKKTELVPIVVEAGSKKLATIRAMLEINKKPEYKDLYKNVEDIRMVK